MDREKVDRLKWDQAAEAEEKHGCNRDTHTHNRNKVVSQPEREGSMSIYHMPSVFFSELVERDRGLRMILIVCLLVPHPHALNPHTRPLSLECSDQPSAEV